MVLGRAADDLVRVLRAQGVRETSPLPLGQDVAPLLENPGVPLPVEAGGVLPGIGEDARDDRLVLGLVDRAGRVNNAGDVGDWGVSLALAHDQH